MRKGAALVWACVLMWGGSALARQDGSENIHSRTGGKAAEHMSEHGLENTNAQWSDGAAKRDRRSGLRHQDSHGSSEKDRRRGHGKDKHEGHRHGKDKGDKGHKGHKDKKNHDSHQAAKAQGHKNVGKEY